MLSIYRKTIAALVYCAIVLPCTLVDARADETLNTLLADYKKYGLPLPAKDAPLLFYESSSRWNPDEKTRSLLFLESPATKDREAVYLEGCIRRTLGADAKPAPVKPSAELAKQLEKEPPSSLVTVWTNNLAVAIQCHSRGWTDLARAVLELDYSASNTSSSDRERVLDMAWEYHKKQACVSKDRKQVAKQLKVLLDTGMKPYAGIKWARAFRRDLLEAIKPSTAKPGSVAALIDGLTEYDERQSVVAGVRVLDDPYDKLVGLGLEAVPELLSHIDDRRLTRWYRYSGIGGSRPWVSRVSNQVREILQRLAGPEEYKTWWKFDGDTSEKVFDRQRAEKWRKSAVAMGEEAYLVGRLYGKEEDETLFCDDHIAAVLAARYPKRLLQEYHRAVADKPTLDTLPLATAVSESKLPKKEKIAAFVTVARNKTPLHRAESLRQLLKLEYAGTEPLLLEALEYAGKTPPEKDEEVGDWAQAWGGLVWDVDTEDTWKALVVLGRRSPLPRRLKLFWRSWGFEKDEKKTRGRIVFLATFLEDATILPRDLVGSYGIDSIRRDRKYDELAVRDLAAVVLASLVGVKDKPNKDWSEEQWSKFRNRVQAQTVRTDAKKATPRR